MANRLGVYFKENDQSQTVESVGSNYAAMAVYSLKGQSDNGAVLCLTEDDVRKKFTAPHATMTITASQVDYGRSLQNAMAIVKAKMGVWLMRAIPTGVAPVYGKLYLHSDGASPTPHKIEGTARGFGTWYSDNLRVVIAGLEYVTRTVNLTATAQAITDIVLPRSFKVTIGANSGTDKAATYGSTQTAITVGTDTVTIKYEDSTTGNVTSLKLGTGTQTATISYWRTTADHAVRLIICDAAELAKSTPDPLNNYYESWVVSYKEAGQDELGNNIFIEEVMKASEYLSVVVAASFDEASLPISTDMDDFSDALDFDTVGTDGTYAASDADIVTALTEFEKKKYDFIYMPDAAFHDDVKKKIATVCQYRLFPHGYIDPPASIFMDSGNKVKNLFGKETNTLQALIAWRMGLGMGTEGEFVSLAGSTWGQINDTYNGGRKLWMPPSYKVVPDAITVDEGQGAWKTTAGPRRGILDFNLLAINLYEQKNDLNVKQVNPLIIDERGVQMFYGNKTMKSTSSAMQQTTNRKVRSRMSRDFYFTTLAYVHEQINEATINSLQSAFEDIIGNYKDALDSYTIVVGPPKTTTTDLQQQRLRIGVGLIFIESAEEIVIETTVFKIGDKLTVAVV